MNLEGVWNIMKDALFPVFCVGCQQEGAWWCQVCLEKDFKGGVFCCPVCHQVSLNGQVCIKCKATSFLNGSVAFFNYNESAPIGILIKNFKFNLATAGHLSAHINIRDLFCTCVIYIPLIYN